MTQKIYFDKSKLTQEQDLLLDAMASLNKSDVMQRDLVELEVKNIVMAQAIDIITATWDARARAEAISQAEVEPKQKRKLTPNGKCAKCFQEAVLVKSSGLCKPCHMMALKAAKQIGIGQARVNRQIADRNAKETAGVERVVAKAQASGTIGKAIPLDKGKLVLSGTKVG